MPSLPKLKHANGTEVAAQEAYNAFINSRVLITYSKTPYEAISMVWYDNSSAQDDPANVGYVKLRYATTVNATVVINEAEAGDSSLAPGATG